VKVPLSIWDKKGALERLKALVDQGVIAAIVARTLSEEFNTKVTRNAVLGKMHRLKMKQRKLDNPPPPKVKIIKVRLAARKNPNVIKFGKPEPVRNISINQLRRGVCHYPISELNQRPPYTYCGARATDERETYCTKHFDLMHTKTNKQKGLWK
jgi:hypothetical protein